MGRSDEALRGRRGGGVPERATSPKNKNTFTFSLKLSESN